MTPNDISDAEVIGGSGGFATAFEHVAPAATQADIGGAPTAEQFEQFAMAQARRDRAKLVAAQAEIAALEARVEALERSPSRRALEPARRAFKLARRLLVQPRVAAPDVQFSPAPGGGSRGLALVIDHNWPQPDHDSGSIDIVNLVQALDRLGFQAMLAASEQHAGRQPARDRLVAEGLRCLGPDDAASVAEFIAKRGSVLALAVMCRVYCGGEFLEQLQRHARQARLVFNSIDLNFLREERRALALNDAALLAVTRRLRDREEHVIRSSDVTLVVSQAEWQLLAATMPDISAACMPLARKSRPPNAGFGQRSGIGFIGGFAHGPNVDAVRYFLAEIWPLVRRALPGCEFSIVGADAPEDLAGDAGGVHVLGHQADAGPWFDGLRLTVAPLRYGAGAKGKVASSLASAVPCVVTGVAAEGMSLLDRDGVLIRDAPADFAAAIIAAHTDAELWQLLSQAGLAYAERTLSPAAWQSRLDAIVRRIGL